MANRKRRTAPITVFTNGDKFASKRFIFNPKYVRTFDALLDELTLQTNATCAVRRIYTPHGSRQVGNLSGIEPGGSYVAVSRGRFKKIPYGQGSNATSSENTATTKSPRRRNPTSGRLQRCYDDQMSIQKTIYVHRNGHNEPAIPIFFNKRLLRNMNQVLDLVQEKIAYERAIISLHKLNGLTIDEVTKLQAEERYVAVEQGQRFKRIPYDQVEAEMASSPRKQKLPAIKTTVFYTSDARARQRLPSNESSQGQGAKAKPKLKLPVIKQRANEPAEFKVIYGYPRKDPNEGITTHKYQLPQRDHENQNQYQGPFHATGAQRQIATEIWDDKRVKVEKPVDMMVAREVEERLDRVNYPKKEQHRAGHEPRGRRTQPKSYEKQNRQPVSLPRIVHVSKPPHDAFPTKPSIAHPHRHTTDKYKRSEKPRESNNATVRNSLVNDQRFTSQENSMDKTKRYVVTREQRLFNMHGRDGREPAKDAVQVYATDARVKDSDRKSQERERKKRIEQWVDQTVEEKQKADEIATVAKQLVVDALSNAARTVKSDGGKQRYLQQSSSQDNGAPNFYDNTNGVKYHRVFGQ